MGVGVGMGVVDEPDRTLDHRRASPNLRTQTRGRAFVWGVRGSMVLSPALFYEADVPLGRYVLCTFIHSCTYEARRGGIIHALHLIHESFMYLCT